ncbi:heme-binding protein 2-like [Penaeus monodon]|uniref:heme-binding protein 2-like n=1 Tax=Penaeus monodon TaxID=6687 RepID=UPI0018A7A811|nr:heme-binding protein 2-like [Penaeus monodon]
MKLSFVVAFLVCAQLARAQYEDEPNERAPYSVLRTGDGYEVRAYPAAKWVCHSQVQQAASRRKDTRAFFALFRYIDGGNEAEAKIPMTAPVSMKKTPIDDKVDAQMCFYLPAAHQASPPAPTNAELYIEERPAFTAFVRIFDGFANKDRVWEEASEALKVDLEAAQEDEVDFSFFYRAGYDSPMKFKNRRNEVWFLNKKKLSLHLCC